MTIIPTAVAEKEMGEVDIAREFDRLRSIILANFDMKVWQKTEACLSVCATLMLEDLVNPIGFILVGGPSSNKTTVLSLFYELPFAYHTDSFTPASFVSQAANVAKEKLGDVDLLPRIKHKCLVVPELAPVFGVDKDQLAENLAIMTRVFDGEGYSRDSGVHGRRGYYGDYHFAMLGATVPLHQGVWRTMGSLGSRFLFLSFDEATSHSDDVGLALDAIVSEETFNNKKRNCREAVRAFFEYLSLTSCQGDFHRSVSWPRRTDKLTIEEWIARLAAFTSCMRSENRVWTHGGDDGRASSDFSVAINESPTRLATTMHGLARGHAIVSGRRYLTCDDLPLIAAVALSSIPDDRRRVVSLMIEKHHPDKSSPTGEVTSSEVSQCLRVSPPTATKMLRQVASTGLGELSGGIGSVPLKVSLNGEFSWLLSDEIETARKAWDTGDETEGENGF